MAKFTALVETPNSEFPKGVKIMAKTAKEAADKISRIIVGWTEISVWQNNTYGDPDLVIHP